MLNNKDDDKYEAPDESEYHFSDEESYEAEPEHTETTSDVPKASPVASLKDRILGAQSSPSKRMIISLVVFIGLLFVVYKIVAPTSSTAAVDIQPTTTAMGQPMSATPAAIPATTTTTVTTVSQQAVATPAAAPATPIVAVAPPAQPVAATQPIPATVATNTQQQAIAPDALPQQPTNPVATQNPLPGAPDIIPVESPATTAAMTSDAGNLAVIPAVQQAQNVTANDVKLAEMQANSAKMISQLQADYAQKIADFQNQNKMLQDEVSTLNAKIGTIETQMTQLVQTLTRQAQQQGPTMGPKPMANEPDGAMEPQASNEQQPHIAYNVQAIIPGRAWLRSDNGDTLTVAEGDTVKSLGRVTKIDPYDGVVEINTGHKVIALSYGNGA